VGEKYGKQQWRNSKKEIKGWSKLIDGKRKSGKIRALKKRKRCEHVLGKKEAQWRRV